MERVFLVVVHVHSDHAFRMYLDECSSCDMPLYRGLLIRVGAVRHIARSAGMYSISTRILCVWTAPDPTMVCAAADAHYPGSSLITLHTLECLQHKYSGALGICHGYLSPRSAVTVGPVNSETLGVEPVHGNTFACGSGEHGLRIGLDASVSLFSCPSVQWFDFVIPPGVGCRRRAGVEEQGVARRASRDSSSFPCSSAWAAHGGTAIAT
jgi:hypothetical protein